jgi:hypothetical protein
VEDQLPSFPPATDITSANTSRLICKDEKKRHDANVKVQKLASDAQKQLEIQEIMRQIQQAKSQGQVQNVAQVP